MKIQSLSMVGAVAMACALALPAQADESDASLIVVRDAETGQMRMPTAAEAAALTAPKTATDRNALKRNFTRVPMRHSSGAVGVRLPEESVSYAVVTKRADGTVAEACVQSKSEAEKAVQSGLQSAQQAEEK